MDQQNVEALVKRMERLERRSQMIIAGLLFVVICLGLGMMGRNVRAASRHASTPRKGDIEYLRRFIDDEKNVVCYQESGGSYPPLSCVKL